MLLHDASRSEGALPLHIVRAKAAQAGLSDRSRDLWLDQPHMLPAALLLQVGGVLPAAHKCAASACWCCLPHVGHGQIERAELGSVRNGALIAGDQHLPQCDAIFLRLKGLKGIITNSTTVTAIAGIAADMSSMEL